MDNLELSGININKIYSFMERFVCVFSILLLSIFTTFLFVNYNSKTCFVIIAFACIVFIIAALIKLFFIPSYILISNDRLEAVDFPFYATNKFFDRKRGVFDWNSKVYIPEIKKIELITLTKKEQKINYGYIRLFNKFLKFDFSHGRSKYVYVGTYSSSQIKRIVKLLTKNILPKEYIGRKNF